MSLRSAALAASLGAALAFPGMAQFRDHGRIEIYRSHPSHLGVEIDDITAARAKDLRLAEERGVEIKSVASDSPAAKAGLQPGDLVLEFNGQRVESTAQFRRMVIEIPPGRQVQLQISRNGATQTVTATIGEGFGNFRLRARPRLGISMEPLGSQLAEYFGVKEGALVTTVEKGSAAEKAGLKAGDVIVKIDDRNIASAWDVLDVMRSARSKTTIPLTVVRNRAEMALSVTHDQ
jgi:serine protease Do